MPSTKHAFVLDDIASVIVGKVQHWNKPAIDVVYDTLSMNHISYSNIRLSIDSADARRICQHIFDSICEDGEVYERGDRLRGADDTWANRLGVHMERERFIGSMCMVDGVIV